jgi:parallel beta-helix repeat protein
MRKTIILALAFLLLLPLAKADTYLTDCAELNVPGETYYLTQDIIDSSADVCMSITADNIILDCQGHTIDGIGTIFTNGICVYRSSPTITNITIKNCILTDWDYGIYFHYSDSNTLLNITVSSNSGIYIEYSDYITIKDSVIQNNTVYDVIYQTDRIGLDCHSNFINVIGTDNKPIVFYNTSVTIKNWDNNASEIILCGADSSVIDNVTISHTNEKNNGLLLVATNLTNISNSVFNNSNIGIWLFHSESNTLQNITANSNSVGIHLHILSNSNTLSNITANFNSDYGIIILYSNSNTLSNITANFNSAAGIALMRSDSNTIKNSIIQGNSQYGIYLFRAGSSGANLIYNNLFNNTVNFYFSVTIYANYWNTTRQEGTRIYSFGNEIGGNYWTNPEGTGYSDTCTDADKDGFCDDPYVLATDNVDYLALSNEYSPPPTTTTTTTTLPTTTTTLPPVHGVPLLSSTLVGIVIGFGIITFMLRTLFDIREPKKVIEYFIVLAVIVLTVITLITLFA